MEETLQKALQRIETLLKETFPDSDEIHRAKSLLYVAIERTGMQAERLLGLQRLLRELLILVTGSGDFRDYERRLAQTLLRDLLERYRPELGEENSSLKAQTSVVE